MALLVEFMGGPETFRFVVRPCAIPGYLVMVAEVLFLKFWTIVLVWTRSLRKVFMYVYGYDKSNKFPYTFSFLPLLKGYRRRTRLPYELYLSRLR